jgi:hypothetical protein
MTVMSGTQGGQTVGTIILHMADLLGMSSSNNRLKNMVKRWINSIIQEIQIADPKMRRTMVTDADFNLIADTENYDVRDTEENGGFGWTNCFEVLSLNIPSLTDRPLEPLSMQQYRNRSYALQNSGPSYSWVLMDQFRVKIVPTPDQAYAGVGDYYQDIPDVTAGGDLTEKVDWPRAWDAVLLAGVEWKGMQWQHADDPRAWEGYRGIYAGADGKGGLIGSLKMHERTTGRVPNKAIVTRAIRSRQRIPHDRSADIRWRGW